MEKKEVFREIGRLTAAGEQLAVATVVRVRGSTPREVGAKMIIRPNGQFVGTVGGGCGEAEVWQEAMRVIKTGQSKMTTVDLTEDADTASPKICGGKMDIFIDFWPAVPAKLHRDG